MTLHAAKSISSFSYDELYELMYHLKQCSESAPEEMRLLLQENPEFTRAIAQAQLKIGLVHISNRSSEKETKKSEDADSQQNLQPSPQQANVSNEFMDELDQEQQQLLEQIQNLAPEVIQSLPAQERRQIMELREAMGLPPM